MGICTNKDNIVNELDKLIGDLGNLKGDLNCFDDIFDLDDILDRGLEVQTELVKQLTYLQAFREVVREKTYKDNKNERFKKENS